MIVERRGEGRGYTPIILEGGAKPFASKRPPQLHPKILKDSNLWKLWLLFAILIVLAYTIGVDDPSKCCYMYNINL